VKSAGPDGFEQNDDFCRTHDALADALMEIKHFSAGLAPPEVERLTPAEVIKIVARSHERRTGTSVRRCNARGAVGSSSFFIELYRLCPSVLRPR
jgi:hypothetical protein